MSVKNRSGLRDPPSSRGRTGAVLEILVAKSLREEHKRIVVLIFPVKHPRTRPFRRRPCPATRHFSAGTVLRRPFVRGEVAADLRGLAVEIGEWPV